MSVFRLMVALIFVMGDVAISRSAELPIDVAAAKKTFKKCSACHEFGADANNKVGPHLNGLLNKKAGSVKEFEYSVAMNRAAEAGLQWSVENLDGFLAKPSKFIKGTKMSFSGVKKETERKNLVLWLTSMKDKSKAETSELLGASATALTGDKEYGEYLSGECVTCHQVSGAADGIPSIVAWPKGNFIHALYEYKTEHRKNPAMITVAKRLGDEEMAALAAYFGSLQPK